MSLIKKYAIGIDCGINNGTAIWNRQLKEFQCICTIELHRLFELLKDIKNKNESDFTVYIENPNTYKIFTNPNPSQQQGAGAVKQTYKHIIQFLEFESIEYIPTKVQGNLKKLDRKTFEKITKWSKLTNEHGRDAAMIVFKR